MVGKGNPNLRRGPGRPKGSRNKKTAERLIKEEIDRQIEEEVGRRLKDADKGRQAVEAAKGSSRKWAKEVLYEFMMVLRGMAGEVQPRAADQPPNPLADTEKFLRLAEMAVNTAAKLAPYESPTYRAIEVIAPPRKYSRRWRNMEMGSEPSCG